MDDDERPLEAFNNVYFQGDAGKPDHRELH